ncbi:MAG: Hsp20/alpha crystallin family protein [Deltaproteobacteria bacterium]|nr:Hsp20/alpha crystallin family protein [Deltaproteobacteria bacterium]MBW1928127.1 Hsp20/alpha crystallin family protein [Deltaproteobacteria bacterium]MBW2025678.1 Hsp20/alpha crystallin family protein [Deltaproteobacteria bacterium]MBW2125580.1 Hsp20/alpha crystallin family protein [Deltaproteobacteria bacterium]RLB23222.1 MAG: Hsp20/alpha crystallin family protein [Deltaproteobacteria bacterium]
MVSLLPRREGKELDRLRREMDRLFDRLAEWKPSFFRGEEGQWLPAIDLSETSKEIIVKAELSGMDPKDIDVSLSGNTLKIQGERKQETEEEGENFHKIERSYGAFLRTIQLPAEVDPDKVKATYKKGVLTLKMPKTKAETMKKIEIGPA